MKFLSAATTVVAFAVLASAAPAPKVETYRTFINGDPYVVEVDHYVTTTTTTQSTPVATVTTTSTTETALIRIPDPKIVSDLKNKFSALAELKSVDKTLIQDIISKLDPLHILSRLDKLNILSKLDPLNVIGDLFNSQGTQQSADGFDLPAYLRDAADMAVASLKELEGTGHHSHVDVKGMSDEQEDLGVSLLGEKGFKALLKEQQKQQQHK